MADRQEEVQDTSDYKLDKRGRKIKYKSVCKTSLHYCD